MLQRQITASVNLYHKVKFLVPPAGRFLTAHHHLTSTQPIRPQGSSNRLMTTATAPRAAEAAADAASIGTSGQQTAAAAASQVVVYDPEALKRTIRGVVFDMVSRGHFFLCFAVSQNYTIAAVYHQHSELHTRTMAFMAQQGVPAHVTKAHAGPHCNYVV